MSSQSWVKMRQDEMSSAAKNVIAAPLANLPTLAWPVLRSLPNFDCTARRFLLCVKRSTSDPARRALKGGKQPCRDIFVCGAHRF